MGEDTDGVFREDGYDEAESEHLPLEAAVA